MCDVQRNDVHFIPNDFAERLSKSPLYEHDPMDEVTAACLDYLIENDLGHFVKDIEQFPCLAMEYEHPGNLSNAIIEISEKTNFDFARLFSSLSDSGVKAIELWIYRDMDSLALESLLQDIKPTRIMNVDICLPFSEKWAFVPFEHIFLSMQRIFSITLFGASIDSVKNVAGRQVILTKEKLDARQCGKIHTHCFSCNIKTFSESQHFNTCLNGKIAITDEGQVKNCPAMKETFGTVDDCLDDIVRNPLFQKFWNIRKDSISVCRDCEFRHVCTDCRAFLANPEDLYSQPLKCGYDPYTTEWQSWSTHPQKQAAINYYHLKTIAERDK